MKLKCFWKICLEKEKRKNSFSFPLFLDFRPSPSSRVSPDQPPPGVLRRPSPALAQRPRQPSSTPAQVARTPAATAAPPFPPSAADARARTSVPPPSSRNRSARQPQPPPAPTSRVVGSPSPCPGLPLRPISWHGRVRPLPLIRPVLLVLRTVARRPLTVRASDLHAAGHGVAVGVTVLAGHPFLLSPPVRFQPSVL